MDIYSVHDKKLSGLKDGSSVARMKQSVIREPGIAPFPYYA